MKTIFAVWYWNTHCRPSGGSLPWNIKSFGSESRAQTWISQNFYQFFQAEGLHIEIECEADIPIDPPEGAKLLVGDRGFENYSRPGRYPPLLIFSDKNPKIEKHRNHHRVNWSQS